MLPDVSVPAIPSTDGIEEWLISRVELVYQGQRWPVIFSHRCLLYCERLTGLDMLTTSMQDPPMRLVRAILFSALTTAGVKTTLSAFGVYLGSQDLKKIRRIAIDAWIASMPDPEPVKDEESDDRKVTWLTAWANATSKDGLGLSNEEWLAMTPRQLCALQKVHLSRIQHEELLTGIITSHIVNFSFSGARYPMKPTDFMPHPYDESLTKEKPLSGEFIMAAMAKARKGWC